MDRGAQSQTLIVVPSERHVELARANGADAVTLRNLVRSLADAGHLRAATPETTRLLTSRLLGQSFASSVTLDDAAGALHRSGARAEDVARVGSSRAQWFERLLDEGPRQLESAGLRDERSDGWAAAAQLASADLGPARRAVIRGLTQWTRADLAFFGALHAALRTRGGEGVIIELPPGAAREPALGPLIEDLERTWATANDAPAVRFVERTLPLERVECIEAAGAESEARAVVHAVLAALERGVAIDRVVLATLDTGELFLEPLRAALHAAKIPFSEPRGRPALAAPRAHAALGLLGLARGPTRRDTLLDVLLTPDLDARRWTRSERGALSGLRGALEALPIDVDRTGAEIAAALERSAADATDTRRTAARDAYSRLLADLRLGHGPHPRAELAAFWTALFEEVGLLASEPRALGTAITESDAGRPELLRAIADDSRGATAIVTAFERTVAAARALGAGTEPVTIGAYLEEVETALAGVGPTRGARRAGALTIGRPRELAGLEFDTLIVCRTSDSVFDRTRDRIGLTLGEEILGALPASKRPPRASDETRFTELALDWLLARARHVVVSSSRRDERGSPERPSRWTRAVERAHGATPRVEPASPLHGRAARVVALGALSRDGARHVRVESERRAYFLDPRLPSGPFTGHADDLTAVVGGSAERPIAVTLLEMYERCPFLAFAAGALRATRAESVAEAIGVRERGSLIHAALAHALTSVRPLLATASPAEIEARALEAASAYIAREDASPLRRAGLHSTLWDVAALIRWSLADSGPYAFRDAERAFGTGAEWGALEIAGIHFAGRIDRIDATSDGRAVRVIDYKSGQGPTAKQRDRAVLQAWLYADKAAAELGADAVESGYLALRRRQPAWTVVRTRDESAELAESARARAVDAARALRAGIVDPRPDSPKSCQRCDARALCRRPLSAPLAEDDEA